MPTIVMSRESMRGGIDGSVKKKAYAFLEKLSENDALPGLHIEPMRQSSDPRVRTGRVDDFHRAVLFRLDGGSDVTYIFHGIYPHDEAIAVANRTVLSINPINGVTELRTVEPTPEPAPGPGEFRPRPEREAGTASGTAEGPDLAVPVFERANPGLTVAALHGQLGIDEDLAARALAAASEEALLEIVQHAPGWQADALLDLATGASVADVAESLTLQPHAAGPADDEALIAGTKVPAAKMEFAYIESNEELRRVIDEGDLGAWRVFLHPEQARYVERDYRGPFRLTGGAGTGKTVVVLHRARRLARANPAARIVLTTFTTNLADGLKADLHRLDPSVQIAGRMGDAGVYVDGIDALAAQVLRTAEPRVVAEAQAAVLGVGSGQVAGRLRGRVWADALDAAGADVPERLRSEAFFAEEYDMVILPHRVVSLEQYLRVRRAGRGVALDRRTRSAVWDVVVAYRNQVRPVGEVDYSEAATIAAECLRLQRVGGGEAVADHVLVDEGQDLSPAHWQLVRALAAEGNNDIFIAEDAQQRIYARRLVLGDYGIRIVGRSRRLTLNYRTTAQNLEFAMRILEGSDFEDLEGEAAGTSHFRSARRGPRPEVIACQGLADELDKATEVVQGWLDAGVEPEGIGILCRDKAQRDRVVTGLAERGTRVAKVERTAAKSSQPQAMTMHRAKGLEFTHVLLFGISDKSIPAGLHAYEYAEDAAESALLRERALLYVASTRARDQLVVTHSGKRSPLLAARHIEACERAIGAEPSRRSHRALGGGALS